MVEHLNKILNDQLAVHRKFVEQTPQAILDSVQAIVDCLTRGNKVLLCGNGGSAADAQHVAAELVGRFTRERRAYPAIALSTDSSILTAIGNDYGFDRIFARQVEALAVPGDIVVGISTSGNSPNILLALETARKMGAGTLGFTGKTGGKMVPLCDICFCAPSDTTARIQEIHICAWHAICDLVEFTIAGND